jgi:hypothetical protein
LGCLKIKTKYCNKYCLVVKKMKKKQMHASLCSGYRTLRIVNVGGVAV